MKHKVMNKSDVLIRHAGSCIMLIPVSQAACTYVGSRNKTFTRTFSKDTRLLCGLAMPRFYL